MSGVDTARLAALLGSPALARLIERARDKVAQGSALDAVVTLRRPSHEERAAVDRLLGRPPSRGASVTLPLGRIDAILRHAEVAPSLGEALIALGGPLVVDGHQDPRSFGHEAADLWREESDQIDEALISVRGPRGRLAAAAWACLRHRRLAQGISRPDSPMLQQRRLRRYTQPELLIVDSCGAPRYVEYFGARAGGSP